MKKNVIIVVLTILVIVLFASVRRMANEASYWMERSEAAESVIERVESDMTDYMLDVLSEGDEYQLWLEYTEI